MYFFGECSGEKSTMSKDKYENTDSKKVIVKKEPCGGEKSFRGKFFFGKINYILSTC